MDLDRLKDFLTLAKELHYERAAILLGTDQSVLSRRIRELERHLGGALFIRTRRGTKLSPAGAAFIPIAETVVAKMEQGQRAIQDALSGVRTQIHLGVCDEIPVDKLAKLIASFRASEKSVEVQLSDAPCSTVIRNLEAGTLDVAMTLGCPNSEIFTASEIWSAGACIKLPATHPLAQQPQIDLRNLERPRLIVAHRDCSCGAREKMDQFIFLRNSQAEIRGAANLHMLRTMVRAGEGFGIVSALQARTLRATDVVCRPLVGCPLLFRTVVLQRRGETTPAAQRFCELARRDDSG